METIFLKGAALAKEIKARISDQVATLASKGIRTKMVVILASNAPSALSYAEMKVKTAASLGITLQIIKMLSGLQNELNATLSKNANDPDVHGILLELPLAEGLNTEEALKLIPPHKDVDGLTFSNIGAIAAGREAGAIASATPLACIRLIESFVPISGKRVAVIGRGKTVGRPLVGLLLNRDATPTICHTKTPDLSEITHACDILIAASGHPNLITESHLKKGHVVIDAGINIVNGATVGDVHFESALKMGVAAISPVPGGVGPLTSALIFSNLMQSIKLQHPEYFA